MLEVRMIFQQLVVFSICLSLCSSREKSNSELPPGLNFYLKRPTDNPVVGQKKYMIGCIASTDKKAGTVVELKQWATRGGHCLRKAKMYRRIRTARSNCEFGLVTKRTFGAKIGCSVVFKTRRKKLIKRKIEMRLKPRSLESYKDCKWKVEARNNELYKVISKKSARGYKVKFPPVLATEISFYCSRRCKNHMVPQPPLAWKFQKHPPATRGGWTLIYTALTKRHLPYHQFEEIMVAPVVAEITLKGPARGINGYYFCEAASGDTSPFLMVTAIGKVKLCSFRRYRYMCHKKARCIDTVDGYTCKCLGGFTGNGKKCRDIDECKSGVAMCPKHSVCKNTFGLYSCECPVGHKLNRRKTACTKLKKQPKNNPELPTKLEEQPIINSLLSNSRESNNESPTSQNELEKQPITTNSLFSNSRESNNESPTTPNGATSKFPVTIIVCGSAGAVIALIIVSAVYWRVSRKRRDRRKGNDKKRTARGKVKSERKKLHELHKMSVDEEREDEERMNDRPDEQASEEENDAEQRYDEETCSGGGWTDDESSDEEWCDVSGSC